MADFTHENLTGSWFEDVYLTGARFHNVDLTGARFDLLDLTGVTIRGSALVNVDISGEIENLRVNGVDVTPLVEAELNRRYPVRVKMRPADAGLTDEQLAGRTAPVLEPGYPEPESFPVRRCLQAILSEEWQHRLYAERDLDALESSSKP